MLYFTINTRVHFGLQMLGLLNKFISMFSLTDARATVIDQHTAVASTSWLSHDDSSSEASHTCINVQIVPGITSLRSLRVPLRACVHERSWQCAVVLGLHGKLGGASAHSCVRWFTFQTSANTCTYSSVGARSSLI